MSRARVQLEQFFAHRMKATELSFGFNEMICNHASSILEQSLSFLRNVHVRREREREGENNCAIEVERAEPIPARAKSSPS